MAKAESCSKLLDVAEKFSEEALKCGCEIPYCSIDHPGAEPFFRAKVEVLLAQGNVALAEELIESKFLPWLGQFPSTARKKTITGWVNQYGLDLSVQAAQSEKLTNFTAYHGIDPIGLQL